MTIFSSFFTAKWTAEAPPLSGLSHQKNPAGPLNPAKTHAVASIAGDANFLNFFLLRHHKMPMQKGFQSRGKRQKNVKITSESPSERAFSEENIHMPAGFRRCSEGLVQQKLSHQKRRLSGATIPLSADKTAHVGVEKLVNLFREPDSGFFKNSFPVLPSVFSKDINRAC